MLIAFILFAGSAGTSFAEKSLQLLRQGNKLFSEGNYLEAESRFRQSLEIDESNYRAWHNLGNALYMQGRLDEARESFERSLNHAPSDNTRAAGWHNKGNSLLGAGQIAESIEAYKQALRLSPGNDDTRYNLAYALNLLEEMPPDATGDDEGEDGGDSEDEGEGGGSQDQQEDSDGDGSEQESGQQEEQDQMAQDDKMAERPEKLSPQDAERILDALRQQEQEIQGEINRETQTTPPARPRREW